MTTERERVGEHRQPPSTMLAYTSDTYTASRLFGENVFFRGIVRLEAVLRPRYGLQARFFLPTA